MKYRAGRQGDVLCTAGKEGPSGARRQEAYCGTSAEGVGLKSTQAFACVAIPLTAP